jgi:hypothetical protein
MFVQPLGCVTQVNMKPPSGGAFPTAPKGNHQVLLLTIVVQCQPNAGEYLVLIVSWRIKIP